MLDIILFILGAVLLSAVILYISLKFDIYEGESLEKDKKAAAFKITLQSPDRTLTDAEMTQAQEKIFKNLENLGGTIRGVPPGGK